MMKNYLFILFVLLQFQNCKAQTEFGEMHIKTKDSQDSILANVSVNLYLNDSLLFKGLKTDTNGFLAIKNLVLGTYKVECSKKKYLSSTWMNLQINSNKITFINNLKLLTHNEIRYERRLSHHCNYASGKRKPKCPICKSKDNVIPYLYGLPTDEAIKESDEGLLKLGGCIIKKCEPYWFCKKDQIDIYKK